MIRRRACDGAGAFPVVGVIIAYVSRIGAAGWVAGHYRFQIRTFWIGLLCSVIGAATLFVFPILDPDDGWADLAGVVLFTFVGLPILFATMIWWVVRAAKGLRYLGRSAPCPKVTNWLW